MPDDENARLAAALKRAELEKAEAEAGKARAEADKARAEADKSNAEARSAAAKAQTDESTAAEHDSTVARRQREAEADKDTAVANKDAAAARQAQISALIPDLSAVKESSLTVTGDVALWGTILAYRALDAAIGKLVKEIPLEWYTSSQRVLITSDSMLVDSDSLYQDVNNGLTQLIDLAETVLGKKAGVDAETVATDVVGALAAAAPAVLSLLSAQRTVTTKAITVSDQAAAAAAAGAIRKMRNESNEDIGKNVTVVHDDFRLISKTGVYKKSEELNRYRGELLVHKVELAVMKSEADRVLAEAETAIKDLRQKLKDATNETEKANLKKLIEETEKRQPQLVEAASKAAARVLADETVLTAIDTFRTTLTTVAAGSQRSLLAAAARRELLHQPTTDAASAPESSTEKTRPFAHVLLIHAEAGSSEQRVSNRPLWWSDLFSTVATVAVTYMLIQSVDSSIVAAGTTVGTATAHGKIGSNTKVTVNVS